MLLDAGAGDHWKYIEPGTEQSFERSEGIAVASLYMFLEGGYTNEKHGAPLVDGEKVAAETFSTIADTVLRPRAGPIDNRCTSQRSTGDRHKSYVGS